jgi:energy-coupling factor transporter transmembrane protein EcfT
MKNLILLIIFIAYTTSIFFVSNWIAILGFIFINLLLMIALKIPIKRVFNNLYKFTFVVFITFVFNILFGYFNEAILIAIRLYIVCNITFIFTYKMGITNILIALEKLFTPLSLFGVSPTDLSLIINIAVTFIPIFLKEIQAILLAMQNKGLKTNSITSIKYTFKILLTSIFKKTSDIELTLKNKNYIEN